MPADFLSRSNLEINAIQLMASDQATQQSLDHEILALKSFRATGPWLPSLHRNVQNSVSQKETSFTTDTSRRFWVWTPHRRQIRNRLQLGPMSASTPTYSVH